MKHPPVNLPHVKHPDFFSKAVEQGRTFFHEKPAPVKGISVISGGSEHCSANYRIDRQDFPYLCLEWVGSGKGELVLQSKSYSLQAGSLFLYGPGIPHRITTDPKERLVKYFVDFTGPQALSLLRKNHLKLSEYRLLPPGTGMLEIFDRLIEAGSNPLSKGPELSRLLLECLLVLASEKYPKAPDLQGRAYQTYLRCRSYIGQNIRNLHRIEEAAEHCHLDQSYLTRIFQRFAKESPHHFLTRLKMDAAALQLVRRRMLVKEVAEEFGYSDPYHFSKTFKKIHGLPPERYLQARR